MTVLVLDRVPPGLRGEVSRWLVEVRAGVFAGHLNALTRDLLWDRASDTAEAEGGSALLLHDAPTAQGFAARTANPKGWYAEDVDGLWLVRRP